MKKSREKNRKRISMIFVKKTLVFCVSTKFSLVSPIYSIYITLSSVFLLQIVIHIFHTVFHIEFSLIFQWVSDFFHRPSPLESYFYTSVFTYFHST